MWHPKNQYGGGNNVRTLGLVRLLYDAKHGDRSPDIRLSGAQVLIS